MTVTPKRFYLIIFSAVVVLIFAQGLQDNFSFFTMMNRTLGGLITGAVVGAVFASRAGGLLAKFDPALARCGVLRKENDEEDESAVFSGFLVVVTACYIVFAAIVPPHGTNITPDHLRKTHLADRELMALSGVDIYNRRTIMSKYGFFLDPNRLDTIPQTAISKIRNPDSIREAAFGLSGEYGSSLAKDKTEAFRLAVKRLYDMGKEDQLRRLYFGIRERAKDKGAASSLGAAALIEIVDHVNDPRFLENVMLDMTAAMEVRETAAVKLGKSVKNVERTQPAGKAGK